MLHIKDLAYSKNDNHLFSQLNFSLSAGHWAWIRGENGVGKSSLLKILCGFWTPKEGRIKWAGETVDCKSQGWQQQLSYLGHKQGVIQHLTAFEYLEAYARLAKGASSHQVIEVLEKIGLHLTHHTLLYRLSAGQRQKLALARLLFKPAKLWLLDEPLTFLDAAGIQWFENCLRDHLQNGGLAVIASHMPLKLLDPLEATLWLNHERALHVASV